MTERTGDRIAEWLTVLDDALQRFDPCLQEMDFPDNRIMPHQTDEDGMPVERFDDLTARLHVSDDGVIEADYRGERYAVPDRLAEAWVNRIKGMRLRDRLIKAAANVAERYPNAMRLLEES
ncbi:hypothetical protein [Bifidobacterium sp. SO1]|uniref:hypothetical protein n=1 Tax=Bifidobacterium sp. SO1 TaxID=2809029 RepID=UPI001BDCC117|nr:hypothetical protein [Bifidobacterium sp. SO1]MBT1162811.1 hypothetical protein [Bifidobacterium sp. SO1]